MNIGAGALSLLLGISSPEKINTIEAKDIWFNRSEGVEKVCFDTLLLITDGSKEVSIILTSCRKREDIMGRRNLENSERFLQSVKELRSCIPIRLSGNIDPSLHDIDKLEYQEGLMNKILEGLQEKILSCIGEFKL